VAVRLRDAKAVCPASVRRDAPRKDKSVKPLFRSLLLARALILDDRFAAATPFESTPSKKKEQSTDAAQGRPQVADTPG
jgi:hypothetical protein